MLAITSGKGTGGGIRIPPWLAKRPVLERRCLDTATLLGLGQGPACWPECHSRLHSPTNYSGHNSERNRNDCKSSLFVSISPYRPWNDISAGQFGSSTHVYGLLITSYSTWNGPTLFVGQQTRTLMLKLRHRSSSDSSTRSEIPSSYEYTRS
jgi:hypothetical protein